MKHNLIAKGISTVLVGSMLLSLIGCGKSSDKAALEIPDFIVEVEAGRDPIVLQLTDPQIVDAAQARSEGRLPEEQKPFYATDMAEQNCYKYLREIITETKPDLILMTGDLVYGEFDDAGTALTGLIEFMESFEIPWAPVMGNHEGESTKGADWQCEQLENAKHCLFKQRDLMGNGNYTVGIKQDKQLKRVFFMLDSNGCTEMSVETWENCHSKIDWEKNYLVVDKISYSTDGVNYSEPWLYVALFEKLLKEQYQGKIFFKYEFDVQTVPQEIYLRTEWSKNYDVQAWLNGTLLSNKLLTEEDYAVRYDVSHALQTGKNIYVLETNWYENDFVHHALFGGNATESLRNLLTYDSELEPIRLEGKFGVYSSCDYEETEIPRWIRGNDFYIGEIPEYVTELTTDGFPFFAGKFRACKEMVFEDEQVLLSIPGDYHLAEAFVNGVPAGKLMYDKELDISHVARPGNNQVEVRYVVHNRNLYGPHHYVKGHEGIASPWIFLLYGTWEGNESPEAHHAYDLTKFY